MTRTVLTDEIAEKSTPTFTFQIVDKDGDGFKPTTLQLTLFDINTGQIINGKDHVDVLDTGGVTVDASGNVEWTLESADTAIVTALYTALEHHVGMFEWTWDGSTKNGKHEIEMRIRNLFAVS